MRLFFLLILFSMLDLLLMMIIRWILLLYIMFFFLFLLSLLFNVVCLVIFFFFSYELFFFVKCLIKLLSLSHLRMMLLLLCWSFCNRTKTFICIRSFYNLLVICFFVWTNFCTIWCWFYTSDLSCCLNFSYISTIFINFSN
jgi:hypothetical protein